MEKYITNIKDLVRQFMTNGKEMEAKAKEGDAASCFQMGMVHLLGIKASVDFKKASQYFSNQSLADDADAKVVEPLETLCTEQNVPVSRVSSMKELGTACNIEVGAAAAAAVK